MTYDPTLSEPEFTEFKNVQNNSGNSGNFENSGQISISSLNNGGNTMRTQLSVRAGNFQPQRFAKIALAAALGLAITFTFSCSSDNIGDGGGGSGSLNLSDFPKQAYFVVWDYDGNIVEKRESKDNGDITFRINLDDDIYESKPAGRIQNGQVQLNLPDIESRYLMKLDDEICQIEKEYGYECKVSFPKNLTSFYARRFYITIPGKSNCILEPYLIKSDVYYRRRVYIEYYSQSGKITGTDCNSGNNNNCSSYNNYDWNFSKGWNVWYVVYINADTDDRIYTSNFSKTSGTLEWLIKCDDN